MYIGICAKPRLFPKEEPSQHNNKEKENPEYSAPRHHIR